MSRFLDIALQHAALGLYVFPVARDKGTLTAHGFKDATVDPETIGAWWVKTPSANPGFAPGVSDVAVLDVDHGLTDLESFLAWRDRNGIPKTYTVRSGSRPEFKVHMYFKGAMRDVGIWELDGCSGQVKSLGGYVLAAGSEAMHGEKHDKLGAPYAVIDGVLGVFADTPDVVRNLRKPVAAPTNTSKVPKTAWNLPVHEGENRTGFLMEQTGAMRNLGCGKDAILAHMMDLNDDPEIIADPVDSDRLERTAENCARFPVPEPVPVVTIGSTKPEEKKITGWRLHYHTKDQVVNVAPPEFLITGFLQRESITAIAGFCGHKKSLIAQNVSYALVSGEPLFGHFEVVRKPTRVLYLTPEQGLIAFADRIKRIGLLPYVGETFFCATMSLENGVIQIPALMDEEIAGAVIILDTATRFVVGDENSAEDMKKLASDIFGLIRRGAESVVLLAHSSKSSVQSNEITLDNVMRGSSELTAFLSSCWGTRLQDQDNPYDSASLLKNVKPRDFESMPFEVVSDRKTCQMTFVPGSEGAVLAAKTTKQANLDGKEDEALKLMTSNPKLSHSKMSKLLKDSGIDRSPSWVGNKRREMSSTGVKTGEVTTTGAEDAA